VCRKQQHGVRLCRYAADSRQHSSSGKHNASDDTYSEHQGDSEPARWRDKPHRPGPNLDDPRSKPLSPDASLKRLSAGSTLVRALLDMQRTIGSVLVIPTFRIVVLQVRPVIALMLCLLSDPIICTMLMLHSQGIVGSIPWNAMVFFTLYFQLLGFSDLSASILMAVFTLGCAVGALIGGALGELGLCICLMACTAWALDQESMRLSTLWGTGDHAAQRSPISGRVYVAQASVFAGLPLSWVLFRMLPLRMTQDAPPSLGTMMAFGFVLTSMGLTITWWALSASISNTASSTAADGVSGKCSSELTCCVVPDDRTSTQNAAIFSAIVRPELRSMVFAFDRSFEGAIAGAH